MKPGTHEERHMSADTIDRSRLPIRRPPFTGVTGKMLADSQPGWELIGHVEPPEGAPNGRADR